MKATNESASELLFPLQYRGKALALLLLQPQRRLHVREIARLTGTVAGTMNKELGRLQRAGLLERHSVGNQLQYCANPAHPVFPELSALLRTLWHLGTSQPDYQPTNFCPRVKNS